MMRLSRRQLAGYAADKLLGGESVNRLSRELAAVLISTRRAGQAELLVRDIAWELEHRGQAANAQVTTAASLSDGLRRQINEFIKRAAGVKTVIINEHIDKSVIGGIRIDTASRSWDKTLKRELSDIQEEF